MNLTVTRTGDYVKVNINQAFGSLQPDGLLITADEASHLRVMLGEVLCEH